MAEMAKQQRPAYNYFNYAIFAGVVALIIILLIVAGGYASSYLQGGSSSEANSQSDQNNTTISQSSLDITSPANGDIVGGNFVVKGTITTDIDDRVTVRVYDDQDKLIAERTTRATTTEGSNLSDWTADIDVSGSPTSSSGYITAFPTTMGEGSIWASQLTINFEKVSSNRVRLVSPIKDQLITNGKLQIVGQAKDFFEATLSIRIVTDSGQTVFDNFRTLGQDNYDRWAKFDFNINIKNIPEGTTTGKFQIYESSPKDGSESILLNLPIQLSN